MLRKIGALALFVGVPLGVGLLSGLSTMEGVRSWYQGIAKPSWTPPDRAFGPTWTVLYVSMGIAAFLVWLRASDPYAMRAALALFALQLVLNGLWSFLFFGLRSPGLALVEIVILLALVALTLRAFHQQSRLAGWLMAPYLAWVGFATILNFSIWRLNA